MAPVDLIIGNVLIVGGLAWLLYAVKVRHEGVLIPAAIFLLAGVVMMLIAQRKKGGSQAFFISNVLVGVLGLFSLAASIIYENTGMMVIATLTAAVGGLNVNLAYFENEL